MAGEYSSGPTRTGQARIWSLRRKSGPCEGRLVRSRESKDCMSAGTPSPARSSAEGYRQSSHTLACTGPEWADAHTSRQGSHCTRAVEHVGIKTTSFAAARAPGATSCLGHQTEEQTALAVLGVVPESPEFVGSHGFVAADLAR